MEVQSGRSVSAVRGSGTTGTPHPPRLDRFRIVRRFTTALTAVPATPNAAQRAPVFDPDPSRARFAPTTAPTRLTPARRPPPLSNGSSTGIPCRRDCLGPFPSPVSAGLYPAQNYC